MRLAQNVTLITSVVVALVGFWAYRLTVAPSITWTNGGADGGDLARAVLVAGIPHPPGYPTYMLLGLAWSYLPFGGDLAHRLALLSAVGAACAVGLTTLTIMWLTAAGTRSATVRAIAGLYGGLTLAWSPLLWSQATICEVYAPGLAWVALLGLLLLGRRPLTVRRAVLAAATGGLAFGALPQIVLGGPGALIIVAARFGQSRAVVRCLCWCGLAAALGLSTQLYLPLRAAADPLANWGDPSSPERFLAVITTAEYRYVFGVLGPADWLVRSREGLFQLGQNLTPIGLGLALVMVKAGWSSRRAEVAYLSALLVLTLLVRAVYPAEGNLVYLIPAVYAGAVLAGCGLAWLLVSLPGLASVARIRLGPRRAALLTGLLAAGLLGVTVERALAIAQQVDASGDRTALLVAERLLDAAPPEALLLSHADETTFALWYVQALGRRADVVVVEERLLVRDWYRAELRRRYPTLSFGAADGRVTRPGRPRLVVEGSPAAARLRPLD